MSEHLERLRLVPEHLDDRCGVGLDPDRRGRRAHVAKERTDDDAGRFRRSGLHGGQTMRLRQTPSDQR